MSFSLLRMVEAFFCDDFYYYDEEGGIYATCGLSLFLVTDFVEVFGKPPALRDMFK
jgi:hypothetical protein